MHKTIKKTLGVFLSLIMLLSVIGMAPLSAIAAVTITAGAPEVTFYVPETIYLDPSDNKTFQYYVDREQSVNGNLRTGEHVTGYIYFYCSAATRVNSVACGNNATVSISPASASSGELKSSISSGSLNTAIAMNSVTLIPWTVTFTVNGVQRTVTAYSVAYAPNRNVTANGATGYDYNSKESFASSLIYIQGAQTTATSTIVTQDGCDGHDKYLYQNITTTGDDPQYLDPLVNGVAHPTESNPHDYGSGSSPFTGATKSLASCHCVREKKYDGDGDWTLHINCNRTPAEMIVDKSRYANTSQIPNLKLGFIVTDYLRSTGRRNYFVSDATSEVSNADNLNSATLLYNGRYNGSDTSADLLKHSRWKEDDFCKGVYGSKYGTILIESGNRSAPSTGDDHPNSNSNVEGVNDDEGIKYLSSIDCSVSGYTAGSSHFRYFRGGACGNQNDSYPMSSVLVILKVTTVSKESLRSLVNTCVGTYVSPFYSPSDTYFNNLQTAFTVLGNPKATASEITNAYNALNGSVPSIGSGVATVTHKSETGTTIATESQSYTYGQTVSVSANDYPGYQYVSANPSTTTVTNVTDPTLDWELTYSPKNYQITYTLNGGEAEGNPATYNVETNTFTLSNPTKEGYTFTGWSGTELDGENNMTVTVAKGSVGIRSYTAHWQKNYYTVTFTDENDHVIGTPQTVEHGGNATPPDPLTKEPDATYHYTFNPWTGYTNITAPTVIKASFTAVEHVYDQHVQTEEYLDTEHPVTCTTPAQYFESCVCGRKGTTTFPDATGATLPHNYVNWVAEEYLCSAATCQANATYYVSCADCHAAGEATFEDVQGGLGDHDFTAKICDDYYLCSAATCVDLATYYYACALCGEKGTETFEDEEGGYDIHHQFTKKIYLPAYQCTPATCQDYATYYYVCELCDTVGDVTFVDEEGGFGDHDFTKEIINEDYLCAAATCTSDATYYYACSLCDAKGDTTFTPEGCVRPPHVFIQQIGEDHLFQAATCSTKAIYYKSCETCGLNSAETFEDEDGEFDYTNHSTEATEILNWVEAGYTVMGYSGDECCCACHHVITPGEATPKLLITENEIYIHAVAVQADAQANPGIYDAADVQELNDKLDALDDALAIDNNEEAVIQILNELNDLITAMCGAIVFCEVTFLVDGVVVDTQQVPAGGDAVPPAQETYINNGENHKKFSGWNGSYTHVTGNRTITATYNEENHIWTDGEITLQPTCSEKGTQNQTCACGAENEKILDEDPTNHADYGTTLANARPATCKTDGQEADTVCAGCGLIVTYGATLPKIDVPHTPGDPVVAVPKAPTCVAAGKETTTVRCTVCGKRLSEESRELPATGVHTLVYIEAKAPTEVTEGNKEYWYCSKCDGYFADAEAAHHLGKTDVRIAAIDRDGHCLYCGEVHDGVFGSIIHIFHLILNFFRNLSSMSKK